jgi:hypothetical protein
MNGHARDDQQEHTGQFGIFRCNIKDICQKNNETERNKNIICHGIKPFEELLSRKARMNNSK